jgi:glycosyl hydrolase family 43/concanavalin A-like lectin/glucanase superfamily protein/ricin-type beta-trefoil lectin protein
MSGSIRYRLAAWASRLSLAGLCLMAVVGGAAATASDASQHAGTAGASGQIPVTGQVAVHDPTLFKAGDTYIVAATHNSIRSAPSISGPWTTHGNVPKADWTFAISPGTLWAPHVEQVGDTFFYYYSQSTFGSRTSAIGVKTTTTPTDPSSYVDLGRPIIASGAASSANDPVIHNAIDPQVHRDREGNWWIVWGSHWDGIVIGRLEDDMVTVTGPMRLIASRGAPPNRIEGPAIFERGGYYYLLTGWDVCCQAANSTYKVSVGRSRNIDGPYVDKNGVPLTQGGGTTILDSRDGRPGVTPEGLWRAPGGPDVFVEDGRHYMVYHAYLPTNTLGVRPIDWHDGWPYFHEPGGGPYDLSDRSYYRLVSEWRGRSSADIGRVSGREGFGSALRLNGPTANEHVNLPNGVVSDLEEFTVAAWVNRATVSGQQWSRVFDLGTGGQTNMSLTIHGSTGAPRYAIRTQGGADVQDVNAPASARVPAGQWTHVAVTYRDTTATIYINGQPVGSNPNITHRPRDLGNTNQNWIGRSQFAGDPLLNATVDDFHIFDRALSTAEVEALMAAPGGGFGGGNVVWYRFDEEEGAAVVDSSGSGRDGTIILQVADPDSVHNPVPSDRCLTAVEVEGDLDVIQRRCDDSLDQVWQLQREFDGFYRLRSMIHRQGKCLAMADGSDLAGTNVTVAPCDPSAQRQEWYLDDTGHGFHRPVVKGANLALEVDSSGGVMRTDVIGGLRRDVDAGQWPPQQWMLAMQPVNSDLLLAAFDGFVADGRIEGSGPGRSNDHRLAALRNMLVSAAALLEAGDRDGARQQLADAQARIHVAGDLRPSHFATGEDAATLRDLIGKLKDAA